MSKKRKLFQSILMESWGRNMNFFNEGGDRDISRMSDMPHYKIQFCSDR